MESETAVIERTSAAVARIDEPRGAMHPGELIRMAMTMGRDLDTINQLMDLQERWRAMEAKQSYSVAMARFKENTIKVTRSATVKQGPMTGTQYARLSDFVGATAEPLANSGLSISWKITRDEPQLIEVACIVRHVDGHEEERRMSGPPDQSGAKNAIQARASTVSYLEKYTLKMALGLAEEDDDDDGQGGAPTQTTTSSRAANRVEEPPKAAEKPGYEADAFDRNFPKWKEAIEAGKMNHGKVIAMAETRGKLTEDQKKKIREVKAPEAANADA